ncbi:MAG: hypothetical protein FJ030_17275 [Chloroflexi bacterium]|nr:hypothetical protein [Chloroflexota bacterium]
MLYNTAMHAGRQTQLAQALEQILQTVTMQYQPRKVILFGSMASGTVSKGKVLYEREPVESVA